MADGEPDSSVGHYVAGAADHSRQPELGQHQAGGLQGSRLHYFQAVSERLPAHCRPGSEDRPANLGDLIISQMAWISGLVR